MLPAAPGEIKFDCSSEITATVHGQVALHFVMEFVLPTPVDPTGQVIPLDFVKGQLRTVLTDVKVDLVRDDLNGQGNGDGRGWLIRKHDSVVA